MMKGFENMTERVLLAMVGLGVKMICMAIRSISLYIAYAFIYDDLITVKETNIEDTYIL